MVFIYQTFVQNKVSTDFKRSFILEHFMQIRGWIPSRTPYPTEITSALFVRRQMRIMADIESGRQTASNNRTDGVEEEGRRRGKCTPYIERVYENVVLSAPGILNQRGSPATESLVPPHCLARMQRCIKWWNILRSTCGKEEMLHWGRISSDKDNKCSDCVFIFQWE